jgi:chemotaxis signal transduction protein
MGKQNDKFIIILDIDKIFSTEELSLVQEGQTGIAGEAPL